MKSEEVFGMGERIISSYLSDNWIDRNPNIFRFTSPVMLHVGGNDTDNSRKANGYCKFTEEICKHVNRDKVKQYAIYYKSKEHSDAVVGQVMCDTLLKPLYLTYSGSLKPLEEIKANFANINIFAHCKGSSVVTEMGKSLTESLSSFGLSYQDIQSLTQQILVVHYAPFLDSMKDNTFNNAFFFSGSDQLVFSDTYFKRYLIAPKDFMSFAGCGRIYENYGNMYYYTDCLGHDDTQDDHQIPVIRNNYGNYRCEAMLGCIDKLFRVYTNRSIIAHELGQVVDIDRSKLCVEMRENISNLENTHIEQEDEFKRECYHPEQLEKYYNSIANYFALKNQQVEQTDTPVDDSTSQFTIDTPQSDDNVQ